MVTAGLTLSMAGSCRRTPSCHGRRSKRKSRSPSESASCEASLASLATAAAVREEEKRRPDAAVSLTATTSTCMVTYIMMDGVCKHKFFDMVADASSSRMPYNTCSVWKVGRGVDQRALVRVPAANVVCHDHADFYYCPGRTIGQKVPSERNGKVISTPPPPGRTYLMLW